MQAERFRENTPHKLVTDLDAIIQSPGLVRLHGKDHEIKPVLVREYLAFAHCLAGIQDLQKQDKVGIDEIVNAYYQLIFPVLPSITRDDIRGCSLSQLSALAKLVMDHASGGLTDEKKKMLMAGPAN